MTFWGTEIKSGKPVMLSSDLFEDRKLHLTQATLGLVSGKEKSVVQCNVGDNPGVLLCSLIPGKMECISLNLIFAEETEVVFSVLGPTSVHLAGYFIPLNENGEDNIPGEYLGTSDTDTEDASDADSDEYEDDFIDDSDSMESDGEPIIVPNSGVKIEEIEDEEPPPKPKKTDKKKKNKENVSETNASDDTAPKISDDLASKGKSGRRAQIVSESEDEDGFSLAGKRKIDNKNDTDNPPKKKFAMDIDNAPNDATQPSQPVAKEVENNFVESNSKEVANNLAEAKVDSVPIETEKLETPTDQKKSKKKKSKKKKKEKEGEKKGTNIEEKASDAEGKPSKEEVETVRNFPNGLVVETLSLGKPDGKKAVPGKKISMIYTGRLKKNGKIFDSNVGKRPFQFRLGIGEVIKGWDVGVNGMRVGDKRRLTIPPEMGYGLKGAPPQIPGNAWLMFDVQLMDVK